MDAILRKKVQEMRSRQRFNGVPTNMKGTNLQSSSDNEGAPREIDRDEIPQITGDAIYLGRKFQGFSTLIGMTSQMVVETQNTWPYVFRNTGITGLGGGQGVIWIGPNQDVNGMSGFPLFTTDGWCKFVLAKGIQVWAISNVGGGNLLLLSIFRL